MSLKQLKVDLGKLIAAMDNVDRMQIDWYLDTQTGEVLLVSSDAMSAAEEGEDEEDSGGCDPEELQTATRILEDTSERYVQIPEADRHEAYALMEEFIAEVPDPRLRDRLSRAIAGKGAFRRFKDTLLEAPGVRERWFAFENERKLQWARDWLAELNIESTWQPPQTRQKPSDWQPRLLGVDHVQITIPPGSEGAARDFYCEFLGIPEVPKPQALQNRGGFWFKCGDLPVHVGTEDSDARSKTKAHVAYLVTDLPKWRDRLEKREIHVIDSIPIPGLARFEFRDPFGNRVEFVQQI